MPTPKRLLPIAAAVLLAFAAALLSWHFAVNEPPLEPGSAPAQRADATRVAAERPSPPEPASSNARRAVEATGPALPAERGASLTLQVTHAGAPVEGLRVGLVELAPFADRDVDAHLAGERDPFAVARTDAAGRATFERAFAAFSVRPLDAGWRFETRASFEGVRPGAVLDLEAVPGAVARGRVLDAVSLLPLAGAVLLVDDAGGSAAPELDPHDAARRSVARAGAGGRFELGGLRAFADLAVVVAAPGAVAQELELATGAAGERLELGDLFLARGAALDVRVVDAAGTPVVGARVGLAGHVAGEVQRGFAGKLTDAEGRAHFGGLLPGARELLVAADGLAKAKPRFELPPGLPRLALTVPLGAGSTYMLSVVDLEGAPIAGAELRLVAEGERRVVQTDTSGRAVVEHVAARTAVVFARAEGFAPARLDAVLAGVATTVELETGHSFRGQLVNVDDAAGTRWQVGVEPVASQSPDALRYILADKPVAADGSFAVPNVALGAVAVVARSDVGEALFAQLDFTDPERVHELAPDHPLRVVGLVVDGASGRPIEGAEVFYYGLETLLGTQGSDGLSSSTDAAGRFSVPRVESAVGHYVVRAPSYAARSFDATEASRVELTRTD